MATQLASLPEVSRLSSRVLRVLGGNPNKFTLQGTNTYIIGTGSRRLLVDSGQGMPSWITALKDTLYKENAIISQVLITHWHGDHTGGIGHLLEAFPDTEIYKNQPGNGQMNIQDGQQFKVDGATLRAIHTAGHTQDHMSFVLEEEDAMFTGDNVLGHGTAVFEDLPKYLRSLQIMSQTFLGRAYPGHGPVIEDGPEKIQSYIIHRRQREEQVIQVLKMSREASNHTSDELWPSMDIVKIIYKDVTQNLHEPAHGGVLKILQKLESEGKVSQGKKTKMWRLNNRAAL